MNSTFDQPIALITGGARRLGRAIALGLAKEGYAIGLHYHRSIIEAEAVAAEIEEVGTKAILIQADLTKPAEIEKLFRQISGTKSRLEVLVNSAAVMRPGRLGEDTPAAWDDTFALNLRAPWLCGQLAFERMRESGGVIINISDAGSNRPWTGYAAYILSKSALETLTRLQAKEYAPKVRVNALAPGLIIPSEDIPEQTWEKLNARLPLQISEREESIIQAVVFLIRNEYITGEVIAVDGGYRLI